MMFVVLGLFSPGTTRRPPPKNNAKGNDASTPLNTVTAQQPRQPAAVAPSPSPSTPAVSARAENSAHAVVDTAGINVDTHDELEDVLVSLMAEIDVAAGGSAEA